MLARLFPVAWLGREKGDSDWKKHQEIFCYFVFYTCFLIGSQGQVYKPKREDHGERDLRPRSSLMTEGHGDGPGWAPRGQDFPQRPLII